jgi:MoxR-like ATPase
VAVQSDRVVGDEGVLAEMREVTALAERVIANVERVIVGKRREVELTLLALLCGGHVLIEDVPGVGKTTLAKAVAASLGCHYKRIQFTPDLLPSDVTGVSIYNQRSGAFEYRPGPIVANLVLADEINRATPKTQSALLECMEEQQVTVDGESYALPEPFIVMATQNPIEYEGTFPLPEAQLDRFLLRLSLGYPGRRGELELLERQSRQNPLDTLGQVADLRAIKAAQRALQEVHVAPEVKEYIVALTEATRAHEEVYLGASPRGSLALFHAARALAALRGRDYAQHDDVKELAIPTLAHRLIVNPAARMKGIDGREIVVEILGALPVLVPGARALPRR